MSRDVIGIEACQHLLANKDAEIERLRALLRLARPFVVASRSWRASPVAEKIDAAIAKAEGK